MLAPVDETLTELLDAAGKGDDTAQGRVFTLLYDELRRCAHRQLGGAGETLSTTALVHETYVKLVAADSLRLESRRHFMALAARAMRQVLVDHARARSRLKRGGGLAITGLNDQIGVAADVIDLVALDAALSELTTLDPRAGQLVEWRVFGGLDIAEIARMQDLTERTVFRDWRRARAFLLHRLELGVRA